MVSVAPKVGFYLVNLQGNYIIYRFPPDKFTQKSLDAGKNNNKKSKITGYKSIPN